MWVWAAVCCVAAAAGAAASCDVTINGDTYRNETLLSNISLPTGLAVDYSNNTLYCSYQKSGRWISANLDLRTRAVIEMEELAGLTCRFAVDQVLQQVHAGCVPDVRGRGVGGLYQFDSNVDQFVPAGEAGHSVAFVYYNGVLYYSLVGSYSLHTIRRGHSARVPSVSSPVMGMVIDKHKDMIFHTWTGVYRQRPGAGSATRFTGLNDPWALAVDARGGGAAYECNWTGAVHRLHEDTPGANKILDVGECSALTFDRDDNIIYGDNAHNRIVRLVKC